MSEKTEVILVDGRWYSKQTIREMDHHLAEAEKLIKKWRESDAFGWIGVYHLRNNCADELEVALDVSEEVEG